jgi:hypothetical protein
MAREGQSLQATPVSLLKEAVSAQPSIEWFAPTGDYNVAWASVSNCLPRRSISRPIHDQQAVGRAKMDPSAELDVA